MQTYTYEQEEQFHRAHELLQQGQPIAAVEVLENLLADVPEFGKAHTLLGFIFHRHMEEYKRAAEHFRLALKFDPNYTPTYAHLAGLLLERYELKALQRHVDNSMQVPGVDRASLLMRLANAREVVGQYREAFRLYRAARREALNLEFVNWINQSEITRLRAKMNIFQELLTIGRR